ncbi:protein FAM43A-like [Electrophorus electricus]|uniref:PID domain-containing protein n=1 Tax=Electrophorus electricus TaxID=8005 RepID=A0A4W4E080_ELEEL|nr:protein FAM43A-like [Electrophorus electricus]
MPHAMAIKGEHAEGKCPKPWTGLALTSFAKSHPENALNRLGGMFRWKKKTLNISSDDPTYSVIYLGNSTTIQAKGEGCTDVAIRKIWNKSEMGRNGTKMRLTISSHGIRMVHVNEKAKKPGHLYLLHRVTYCVADPRLPKIFAWIYRHEIKHKAVLLRCHAVLVSKPEKAKAMALLLYQTSKTSLAEFQRLKRREDARHQQQFLTGERTVPLLPMRKLMNGQCLYKPSVERSRSAPKLCSITEDSVGEEEEERTMLFDEYLDRECFDESKDELSLIISDLGELCIGNDVKSLKADMQVTRLLSGESTGSESSIDSSGEFSSGTDSDEGAEDKPAETR